MEVIRRLSSKPPAGKFFRLAGTTRFHHPTIPITVSQQTPNLNPRFHRSNHLPINRGFSSWLKSLGNKRKITGLPAIVKAGDPVLHEPAQEVSIEEIGSGRIQKIIDDMVRVMRRCGVGLAAPQIGIPLKIIVLEDTKENLAHEPEEENKMHDRRPFDLLVILNPKLKKKGNKSAWFFEGCLSVEGYRAMVERSLEVEVSGLDRDGKPLTVNACGWQARILQHECDHLDGTLYTDKMVKRTFRTIDNFDLPLANTCPKQGVR